MSETLTYKTKYLQFREDLENEGKTKRVHVLTKEGDVELGIIRWESTWRKYVFEITRDTYYDNACLADIYGLLRKLEYDRLIKRRKKNG